MDKTFFEKTSIFFLIVITILLSLYISSRNELKSCKEWSEKAYDLLPQKDKDRLNQEFEDRQKILEEMHDTKESYYDSVY